MRIIFMGTPEFAVPSLDALVASGHEVCAVYTQPPRPSGRKMKLSPSPVQARANALGIPVFTPKSLRTSEAQAEFAAHGADVAVVAAYGLILPQPILDAPPLSCINVHASLLPRWRGAAPIHRAILAGDVETGVTIMDMDAGLDTGAMRASCSTPIAEKTGQALTEELATRGADLLCTVLANPERFPPQPQPDEGITYAAKIDKAEMQIDFAQPSAAIARQIRAFSPFAWCVMAGERVRLVAADSLEGDAAAEPGSTLDDQLMIACGTGSIRPSLLQRAGKAVMPTDALLRGFPIAKGTRLG